MDSLTDKQQSWGNIYNLDQNIMDIEKYQKNLKLLENKIPESMMEKILGMDIDAGKRIYGMVQHMSETEQQAYINKWNQQQNMSKTFSENFFGDDLAKLQANYESEMKTVTDDLQKEMKQAGVNIAKGLTAGMESETRNLSKSMKKICQNIIKTAKKHLRFIPHLENLQRLVLMIFREQSKDMKKKRQICINKWERFLRTWHRNLRKRS